MTTTEEKKQQDFNFTTAHRVSHADIMTPRPFMKNGKPQGEPKYAGTFIIDPTPVLKSVNGKEVDMSDLAQLKREVTALLQSHNTAGKKLVPRRLTQEELDAGNVIEVQVPWKDGNKEADRMKAKGKDGEIYRGHTLVKASSKYPPALSVLEGGKLKEYTDEATRPTASKFFYSGAYVVPSVGLHWYKGDEGKPDGVSLYFNAALFVKNGPRLGGRSANPAETFKGYLGSISDESVAGAPAPASDEMDDEIPF